MGDLTEQSTSEYNALIEQLAQDYNGRRACTLLWEWAQLPEQELRWQGSPAATFEKAISHYPEPPLTLLKQALFDHPSQEIYRQYLPKLTSSKALQIQLQQILTCCDHCPENDRPYRLGQWLPLLMESDINDAFIAGITAFEGRWTSAERIGAEHQLQIIGNNDEIYNDVAESADACISILNALGDLVTLAPGETASWQKDSDELHRRLAHLVTLHLRLTDIDDDEENEENNHDDQSEQQKQRLAEREQKQQELNEAGEKLHRESPELIRLIDKELQKNGVFEVALFLHSALARLRRALLNQADESPQQLINGLRQALWATRATDFKEAWNYQAGMPVYN